MSIKQEFKNFKRNNEKILILDNPNDTDVISEWEDIRNPLRPPFNFIILSLNKLTFSMPLTRFMLRSMLGMKIGKNVGIAPCEIDPLCPELITIGDNSAIGWHAKILCHGFTERRLKFGKVNIGKNVLVGADSLIGPGVSIGDNSVVAMKSLIIKDIPKNELWGGIPAKRIKKLKGLI